MLVKIAVYSFGWRVPGARAGEDCLVITLVMISANHSIEEYLNTLVKSTGFQAGKQHQVVHIQYEQIRKIKLMVRIPGNHAVEEYLVILLVWSTW
jgi:hypothetical protein